MGNKMQVCLLVLLLQLAATSCWAAGLTETPENYHRIDVTIAGQLPSFAGAVSGSGSDLNRISGVEGDRGFLIPMEERFGILRFDTVAGWWSIALAYETSAYFITTTGRSDGNHLLGSLNMGCGLGAYYNGEIDLYLTGPYLFLYPIYDIPVAFFEGIGGRPYHWKAAVDVGYSYAVDGIPLTLNLYARSLLFWQDNRMGARFDTGVGVGIYIKG